MKKLVVCWLAGGSFFWADSRSVTLGSDIWEAQETGDNSLSPPPEPPPHHHHHQQEPWRQHVGQVAALQKPRWPPAPAFLSNYNESCYQEGKKQILFIFLLTPKHTTSDTQKTTICSAPTRTCDPKAQIWLQPPKLPDFKELVCQKRANPSSLSNKHAHPLEVSPDWCEFSAFWSAIIWNKLFKSNKKLIKSRGKLCSLDFWEKIWQTWRRSGGGGPAAEGKSTKIKIKDDKKTGQRRREGSREKEPCKRRRNGPRGTRPSNWYLTPALSRTVAIIRNWWINWVRDGQREGRRPWDGWTREKAFWIF